MSIFKPNSPPPYDENDVLVINGCRQAIHLIYKRIRGNKFTTHFNKALDSKLWYDHVCKGKAQGKMEYDEKVKGYFYKLSPEKQDSLQPYTFFTRPFNNVRYRNTEIKRELTFDQALEYKAQYPTGWFQRQKPSADKIFKAVEESKVLENNPVIKAEFDKDNKLRHHKLIRRGFRKNNLPLLIVQPFDTNKSISFVDYDVLPPKFSKWSDFKKHLIFEVETLGLKDCCVVLDSPSNKVKLAIAVEIPEGCLFTNNIRHVLIQKFLSKIPCSFGYSPYLDYRANTITRCYLTRAIYQKLQKFETRPAFTTSGYTEGWFNLLPEELPANEFISYHSKKLEEDSDFTWDYTGKIPSFVKTPKSYEGLMRYIKTSARFDKNPMLRIKELFEAEYFQKIPACFDINPEIFTHCIDFKKLDYESKVKNFYITHKYNVNLTIEHFLPQYKDNHNVIEVEKFKKLIQTLMEIAIPFSMGVPILKQSGGEVKLGYLQLNEDTGKNTLLFNSEAIWRCLSSEQKQEFYIQWKFDQGQRENLFMADGWQTPEKFKAYLVKSERVRKDWKFDPELDTDPEYQELIKDLDRARKHVLSFVMSSNKELDEGFGCDQQYISDQLYKQFGYYMCKATVCNSLYELEIKGFVYLSSKKLFPGARRYSNIYKFNDRLRPVYDRLFKVRQTKLKQEYLKRGSELPLWIKEKRIEDGMWYTKLYRATNFFSSEEEFFNWAFSIPGSNLRNRERHIRNSWNYHAHLNDLFSSGPPILADLKQRRLNKLSSAA